VQNLIAFLEKNLESMVRDMMAEFVRHLPYYRQVPAAEQEGMRQFTRSQLEMLLDVLRGEKIDEKALDARLNALGERRARQGYPIDQLLATSHLVRTVLFRYLQTALESEPAPDARQFLAFDQIVSQLAYRFDLGVTRPYLHFQENIIQAQQSFLKHKLSSLFKLVEAISGNITAQEFYDDLLDYLCHSYDVKLTAVFLLDERQRELYPKQATGLSRRFLREQRLSALANPFKQCLALGKAVVLNDSPYAADDITVSLPEEGTPHAEPGAPGKKARTQGNPACVSLYAPMLGRQRAYGLVSLHSLKLRQFSQTEIQQLETLARIIAVALENARFYENLVEEKGKLDAIVNSISDGLILINFHEEIVFINEQAARYLNLPVTKIVGASASLVPERILTNAKEPHVVQASYLRALMNIFDYPVLEFTLYRPYVADIRITNFPVKDRDQRFIGRGLIVEDITREKEINRMKSEFVAIASHTMRTPMTSILGFASLLIDRQLPTPTQNKYLQNIHRESQRLTNILNDMLDLANIEAGKISLKLAPVELSRIVRELAQEEQASAQREMVLDLSAKVPRVIADPDKIRQAMHNLVDNAVKYSRGRIKLTLKRVLSPRFRKGWAHSTVNLNVPGYFPAVLFAVEDHGEGLPTDQLDQIFEPFHRLENERTQLISGTGLGLTIVRYIIEAHGGKVWVESKRPLGNVFQFILPLELIRPDRDMGRMTS